MIMTIEKFKEKMSIKFPNENYTIIYAGKNSYENSIIKCLDCGKKITINTGELFRNRRKNICSKCSSIRQDTQKNRELIASIVKDKGYNIEFFMKKQSQNGNKGDTVRFTCKKCDFINEYFVGNLIKNNSKCECQRCSGQKIFKDDIIFRQELEELYPNKFTLLSSYEKADKDIKVRCNICGFIQSKKPTNLLKNGYCPKCGKSPSRGEDIISRWLDEKNIAYERQKYFKTWNIGIHYFDFYLPDYSLVIEYHGKQHYEFNPYFHKNEENFFYCQNKDLEKKETAIKNGINYLSIKYTNYHHLTEILDKVIGSTTIPEGSRGKRLEIETFHKEKDIVWS